MDVLAPSQRSYNMSRIRGRNTKPEVLMRRLLWQSGVRGFRLHAKVPGKPDIYFPKKKIAVFIDGCFWHGCPVCRLTPATNAAFWKEKILRNKARDAVVNVLLKKEGIRVVRVWEHQIRRKPGKPVQRIAGMLKGV